MIFFQSVLAFFVSLSILVNIHELGHYLVARWCGVKVRRYSFGWGKVIYSRKFGKDQMEWAISNLPLGGYVSWFDSSDPDTTEFTQEDVAREFRNQSVWKRAAIVLAGPMANFLLAIALFAGLFMHGIQEPVAKLRLTSSSSLAYQAGLRQGDLVLEINDKKIQTWTELKWHLMKAGLSHADPHIEVQRDNPDRPGSKIRLSVELPVKQLSAKELEGDFAGLVGLGLAVNPEVIFDEVMPDSPASKAGLLAGDQIIAVGQKPLLDVIDFIGVVNANPGKPLSLLVKRKQDRFEVDVTPVAQQVNGKTVGQLKVKLRAVNAEIVTVQSSFFEAISKAAERVWDTSSLSLKMIGKMFTGEVSLRNISGPITIADYAGQTSRIGAISYINFIAFVSISLGVMNLLPIPFLDGGHLLYYSLEVLTGKPLPERSIRMAQYAGGTLLLAMMGIAFFNDFARLMSYLPRLMP
ncbi:RIP metalloprotease RseP [Undibacterium sp. Di26W]|uniref:RIP metalloprotease RseP n=1 Tax=Undibacterium sp. Di26W TaxID=3413035 RepID=UPI003BF072C5